MVSIVAVFVCGDEFVEQNNPVPAAAYASSACPTRCPKSRRLALISSAPKPVHFVPQMAFETESPISGAPVGANEFASRQ